MKYSVLAAFASVAILAAPIAASAADALHPYSNVDHRVDDGNNTGNSLVPKLNEQQLRLNGIDSRQAVRNDTAWNQQMAATVTTAPTTYR
jgi:hypothetical protein